MGSGGVCTSSMCLCLVLNPVFSLVILAEMLTTIPSDPAPFEAEESRMRTRSPTANGRLSVLAEEVLRNMIS